MYQSEQCDREVVQGKVAAVERAGHRHGERERRKAQRAEGEGPAQVHTPPVRIRHWRYVDVQRFCPPSGTGQRKCPVMETLTLTQKEQARLQVLNSLLAEHMTSDQAATLMGVSARHTRRMLAAYRKQLS